MQIDFGEKRMWIAGEEQTAHVFVATLGHSRRMFAKAYPQETQVEWLDGLEAAFAHFGGIAEAVLMDNPKALVEKPRRRDAPAAFNARLVAFARYWNFKPKACYPNRARTKGKVERGVGYVKGNALAGRTFAGWGALDRHLATWLATVCDHRQLDGSGDTPLARFPAERAKLRPLAGKPPFGAPREVVRTVSADATIALDTNHYSTPWSLIGLQVRVAPSADTIRIYHGGELVAEHPRCEGRHQRQLDKAHFQTGPAPARVTPRDTSLARPLTAYAEHAAALAEALP